MAMQEPWSPTSAQRSPRQPDRSAIGGVGDRADGGVDVEDRSSDIGGVGGDVEVPTESLFHRPTRGDRDCSVVSVAFARRWSVKSPPGVLDPASGGIPASMKIRRAGRALPAASSGRKNPAPLCPAIRSVSAGTRARAERIRSCGSPLCTAGRRSGNETSCPRTVSTSARGRKVAGPTSGL